MAENTNRIENANAIFCCECGEELATDEVIYFDDNCYCEDCFEDVTVVCECCGDRVMADDAQCDDDYTLCQDCYDNHYTTCTCCERIISNDDAYYLDDDDDYPYCYSCYVNEQRHIKIHDYSYKPEPIFHGNDNRFFGVELEIDDGGCDSDNAEEILLIANNEYEDRLYIKKDGSIDDGFELVSQPMTLEYHKNSMPWKEIMNESISMGYLSHNVATCGLHCHVNRTAFGSTVEEQEDVIARILYFVELHWTELLKLSRRTVSQMARWASRYEVSRTNPKDMIEDIKKDNYNRYRCVNITNSSTVEFRMFRGTLRYNTFIATLELVDLICNIALTRTDDEITNLSWDSFVSEIDTEKYSELVTYLKEKNLYTNVSVENGGE